jgi:hypothetical protein
MYRKQDHPGAVAANVVVAEGQQILERIAAMAMSMIVIGRCGFVRDALVSVMARRRFRVRRCHVPVAMSLSRRSTQQQ